MTTDNTETSDDNGRNSKIRRMDDVVSLKDIALEKLEPGFQRDIMEAVVKNQDKMTYLGKICMYHEASDNGPILRGQFKLQKHYQNIEYTNFNINDIIVMANEISVKLQSKYRYITKFEIDNIKTDQTGSKSSKWDPLKNMLSHVDIVFTIDMICY